MRTVLRTRTLRGVGTWLSGSLLMGALHACGANDKVLQPDSNPDAGGARDGAIGAVDAGGDGEQKDHSDAGSTPMQDSGSGTDGDAGTHVAASADCDLNGIWIGRQNTQSLALFDAAQYANNWYYLELQQDGEDVVVEDHYDCGIEVHGTVVVQLQPATTKALMEHNFQKGRRGTFKKQSDGTCALQFDPFWSVRGVSETKYVPSPRNSSQSIAQVQAQMALPPANKPELTEDWDHDGEPGVRWDVSGIVNGVRHTAQRDWTRWFTAPGYTIHAQKDWTQDLLVRADFGNEEVIYKADPGLNQGSTPDAKAEHTFTLRFLGRTPDDARAKALLKNDRFETCMAIQNALHAIEGLK